MQQNQGDKTSKSCDSSVNDFDSKQNHIMISVDASVELEDLSPFMARFTRLTAIRVEFPKFYHDSLHIF